MSTCRLHFSPRNDRRDCPVYGIYDFCQSLEMVRLNLLKHSKQQKNEYLFI